MWKRIYYWISKICFAVHPDLTLCLQRFIKQFTDFTDVHLGECIVDLFVCHILTISGCCLMIKSLQSPHVLMFCFFNAYTLFSLRSNAYYCQRQAIRRYESCIIEMLSDSCEKWRRNIIPSFKRLCIPFGYFNRFSDHPRVTIVEVMLCRGRALPSDVMPCKQIPIFFTLVQATTSYTRQIVCLSMRSCFIQIFTKLMLHYGGLEQWV